MPSTTKTPLTFLALALACGGAAAQSDMTLTPAPGGAVVIQTPAGQPALAVQPTGAVQLPQRSGSAPAATGTPLCLDASSALVACSGSAFIGPQGPQGVPGTDGANGTNGTNGAPGAAGKSAVLTVTPEPAGTNCTAGGQKVEAGVEGATPEVRYICNGLQGPKGDTGAAGAPGSGGGAGVVGLAEARHGCFKADKTILSGAGYAVAQAGAAYTVTFDPALGAGDYTLLVDARTSTGRALAVADSGSPAAGLVLTHGWLEATETIARICFMLAR